MAEDSGRCEGVVTDWKGSWGWVQFADGRRAYVHNSACQGNPLLEGQAITADVVPDPRNPDKWQAQNVERQASYDSSGRVAGVVSEWKGTFGFIQFSDGRRAYVHNSAAGGAVLAEGETVVAQLTDDPKNPGKWQATNVERAIALPSASAGKTAGVVMSWMGTYGFIEFVDGRRAYCHNSACGGLSLATGETILGTLQEDPRNPGKWQAQDVERVTHAGPGGSGGSGGDERLEGKVTQWSGTFGFIQFLDGRRAYVHSSQTNGTSLMEGDSVIGCVVEDAKNPGKWQAVQVERLDGDVASAMAAKSGAILQGPDGRIDGVVSQWSERGYGFIDFADGKRAYVHNSQTGGVHLEMGQKISAIPSEDEKNPGKWCAKDVRQPLGTPHDDSGFGGAPTLGAPTLGAPTLGIPTGARPAMEAPKKSRQQGTITEWSPRGFGFATFDDGTRAYVHNSQCGGEHLNVGEIINADISPDPRTPGKWQAMNIVMGEVDVSLQGGFEYGTALDSIIGGDQQADGAGSGWGSGRGAWRGAELDRPPPGEMSGAMVEEPQPSGGRKRGTVTEWSQRGFGFITCEDGTRAYVHNSQCGGDHLTKGEEVEVNIVADPRTPGKWQATDVSRDPLLDSLERMTKRARTEEH